MKTVYKYPLKAADQQELYIPKGAQILKVAAQHNAGSLSDFNVYLWAQVDTDNPPEVRYFRVAGTGHPLHETEHMEHIGSCLDGPFVWHIFEYHE